MNYSPIESGSRVEREAERWLLDPLGPYRRVIARNYRCRGGELDLVLEERRPDGAWELVFVEVRFRGPGAWVGALESVDGVKRHRLRRAIERFLQGYRGGAELVRFDVLALGPGGWDHRINVWIEG